MTDGITINTWKVAAIMVAAVLFSVWDHCSPAPVEDIVMNHRDESELAREGADPDVLHHTRWPLIKLSMRPTPWATGL